MYNIRVYFGFKMLLNLLNEMIFDIICYYYHSEFMTKLKMSLFRVKLLNNIIVTFNYYLMLYDIFTRIFLIVIMHY